MYHNVEKIPEIIDCFGILEQMQNIGYGNFRKVMESHGILKA